MSAEERTARSAARVVGGITDFAEAVLAAVERSDDRRHVIEAEPDGELHRMTLSTSSEGHDLSSVYGSML